MSSTAVRAEAQSANNKHMVFNNEEHEKFYYEKLGQARYQDCYHKALIYILGMGVAGAAIATIFARPIVAAFGLGSEAIGYCAAHVRFVALCLPLFASYFPLLDYYK